MEIEETKYAYYSYLFHSLANILKHDIRRKILLDARVRATAEPSAAESTTAAVEPAPEEIKPKAYNPMERIQMRQMQDLHKNMEAEFPTLGEVVTGAVPPRSTSAAPTMPPAVPEARRSQSFQTSSY